MSAMTCSDCGRPAAGDVEEWLECDPMRELNVRCGAHLDDMHSDETIPDCQRATIANFAPGFPPPPPDPKPRGRRLICC